MRWERWEAAGGEAAPAARSGHTAVAVESAVWGGALVVVFGGLASSAGPASPAAPASTQAGAPGSGEDRTQQRFLGDVVVLHAESRAWFRPAQAVGPGGRAFHAAAVLGRRMFVFGGRTGRRKHRDVWVLDTDSWQWSALATTNDPAARDFAGVVGVGPDHLVLFGGYDGAKWLHDTHVLDTKSGAWAEFRVPGPLPPPRSGHAMVGIHTRVLVFGGETTHGQILNDCWALKGLHGDEEPRWVKMQLAGLSPVGRAGHSVVALGNRLAFYGGHGDEGWIQRKDVYFEDIVILHRDQVRWAKGVAEGPGPAARAYHSMTALDARRVLLFGGFDGRHAFGDAWWLLPDDPADAAAAEPGRGAEAPGAAAASADRGERTSTKFLNSTAELFGTVGKGLNGLIARDGSRRDAGLDEAGLGAAAGPEGGEARELEPPDMAPAALAAAARALRAQQRRAADAQRSAAAGEAFEALRTRLGLAPKPRSPAAAPPSAIVDPALVSVGMRLEAAKGHGGKAGPAMSAETAVAAARAFFRTCAPAEVRVGDLVALFQDYRRAVQTGPGGEGGGLGRFLHLDAKSLRLADVEGLLREYRRACA